MEGKRGGKDGVEERVREGFDEEPRCVSIEHVMLFSSTHEPAIGWRLSEPESRK